MPESPEQPSPGGAELKTIGIRIGAELYGIALDAIQELIRPPRITRVPRAPAHIRGVINLHGNVVPVVDLARRLGLGQTEMGPSARIVVVEVDGEPVGLCAEQVTKVTRLARSEIQPPPPLVAGIAAEFLDGVARLPSGFLLLLNLDRALQDRAGEGEGSTVDVPV